MASGGRLPSNEVQYNILREKKPFAWITYPTATQAIPTGGTVNSYTPVRTTYAALTGIGLTDPALQYASFTTSNTANNTLTFLADGYYRLNWRSRVTPSAAGIMYARILTTSSYFPSIVADVDVRSASVSAQLSLYCTADGYYKAGDTAIFGLTMVGTGGLSNPSMTMLATTDSTIQLELDRLTL
jgi:hypothetical protein